MKEKGFSLIEILIAVGLIAIFIPAIGIIFSMSIFSASQGEKFSQAYSQAQEQMEAIYFLKSKGGLDWDWVSTPVNTSAGEYYQPSQIGGVWQLGGKTTTPDGIEGFTKKVEVFQVMRCGQVICDIGGIDDNSRKVVVFVSWQERGENNEVKLETYVTRH